MLTGLARYGLDIIRRTGLPSGGHLFSPEWSPDRRAPGGIVPLALAGGRALRSLLFGVTPYDPVAIGLAGVLLAGVMIAAAWLPARRAGLTDPLQSLREG